MANITWWRQGSCEKGWNGRCEAMSCAVVNSIFMERRKKNKSASDKRKNSVINCRILNSDFKRLKKNVLKVLKGFGRMQIF